MHKKLISAIFGLASILLFALPTSAGITSNIIVPLAQDTFVPCAAGGVGELVALTGRIHILSTVTTDSAGGLHFAIHFNPLRTSGIGLDTGDLIKSPPGRNVGQIRDPQLIRARRRKLALNEMAAGRAASLSGTVVRQLRPRTTAWIASFRIKRSVVHLPIGMCSRLSCRHTLRTP